MATREFTRYREVLARMVSPALRAVLATAPGGPPPGSVLRGVPAAILLMQDDPAVQPALAEGLRELAALGRAAGGGEQPPMLRDTAGHARRIYHPLVLHLHLAAFLRRYETLPPAIWGACESALPDAVLPTRQIETFTDTAPPPEMTTLVLWHALCLLDQARLASRDVDAEVIDSVVHAVVNRPGPEKSLHPRSDDESLDAWTYRELSGLHALAGLALARRNAAWSARVEEIAVFHQETSQPDHTTSQPWALFGFLWSPRTRPFAEQQLHDATAYGAATPAGLGAIPAMLLADAADALATFSE